METMKELPLFPIQMGQFKMLEFWKDMIKSLDSRKCKNPCNITG